MPELCFGVGVRAALFCKGVMTSAPLNKKEEEVGPHSAL